MVIRKCGTMQEGKTSNFLLRTSFARMKTTSGLKGYMMFFHCRMSFVPELNLYFTQHKKIISWLSLIKNLEIIHILDCLLSKTSKWYTYVNLPKWYTVYIRQSPKTTQFAIFISEWSSCPLCMIPEWNYYHTEQEF